MDQGEECDDGNNIDGDGCNSDCVIEFCGDGILQPNLREECDDGNNIDGDGCNANCQIETKPIPVMGNGLFALLAISIIGLGIYSNKK